MRPTYITRVVVLAFGGCEQWSMRLLASGTLHCVRLAFTSPAAFVEYHALMQTGATLLLKDDDENARRLWAKAAALIEMVPPLHTSDPLQAMDYFAAAQCRAKDVDQARAFVEEVFDSAAAADAMQGTTDPDGAVAQRRREASSDHSKSGSSFGA